MKSILRALRAPTIALIMAAPTLVFVASLWAIESRLGGLDFKPLPIRNVAHVPEVDPLFQKHVDRFYTEAKERGIAVEPVSMYFAVLSPGYYGLANFRGSLSDKELVICKRYVLIDIRSWVDLNDTQRLILVAHELGHAALGLAHEDWGGRDVIMMPGLTEIVGIIGLEQQRDSVLIEDMFDRMFAREPWSAKWLPKLTEKVDDIESCTVTNTDADKKED